ncbi:hypothetical protein PCASD_16329 [Puccinia coronata f. sp. avenae]|uniref:GPI inositol-deacylase n=1 Tax=Puccinia coronata f. sp. avenae TaxID=200324 RepID=A0A2N5TXK6_9BASI|nr:hypothetical protein PCASD_16329 [Puccinia coronata f. sp. avenae]
MRLLNEFSRLISSLGLLALLFSIYSYRSFTDPLHALDLHAFIGPRVSREGQTSGGARGRGAGSCRMTWMNPSYLPIRSLQSRFSSKYSLHLYREHPWDTEQQPSRSPVLFIPGNAGSYRQIRSIAATTSTTYFDQPQVPKAAYRAREHPGLDFFTLDFNDDFSAFHGQTLVEQAEFANDAIRSILSIYQQSRVTSTLHHHLPLPTSVLIIGHSMGSIVARKMITMPNYIHHSINTILSLSSPHSIPPITFDSGVESVYDEINTLWRTSYSNSSSQHGLLDDMLLVSISGGSSDTTVSSDSSSLLSLAPPTNSLTVFTTSIPGVWSPIDHLAILWCNQLALVMAKALLHLTEPRQPKQVGSVQDRLEILKSHLILGHGIEPFFSFDNTHSHLGQFQLDSLPTHSKAHHLHPPHSSLRLTKADLSPTQPKLVTHIIPVPGNLSQDYEFTLLSNLVANHRLNVVACNGSFETDGLRSCQLISQRDSQLVPQSQFNVTFVPVPGPDDRAEPPLVNTFLQIPHSTLSRVGFLAIQILNQSRQDLSHDDFLMSEFRNLSSSTIVVRSSFLGLSLFGASIQLLPTTANLVSSVHLPGLISSLIAYKLEFQRGDACTREGLFAPLMRQEALQLGESKFHPNIHSAILYTHHSSAYVPVLRMMSQEEKEKMGVRLTFWTDPLVCGGTSDTHKMQVRIQMDVYESVRRILLRYRTAFVSLPLGWLALMLSIQFRKCSETGRFMSFGAALSLLVRDELLKIMLVVGASQLVQSTLLGYDSGIGSASPISSRSFGLIYPPPLVMHLLLGQSHFSFVLLDWLLLLVSIGWLVLVFVLLQLVVGTIASVWIRFGLSAHLKKHNNNTTTSDTLMDYSTLGILMSLGILTIFYAPYHFALLVLTAIQLVSTLQSFLSYSRASSVSIQDKTKMDESNYNYHTMILLMMIWLVPVNVTICLVWLRNLQEGWYEPFSDSRNPLNLVGWIGLSYLNRLNIRTSSPRRQHKSLKNNV